MVRNASVGDLIEEDLDGIARIDFEEIWGDPLESKNTDLEKIPEDAVIDFGSGVVKDCSIRFIIKRAMLDPVATVLPDGGQ